MTKRKTTPTQQHSVIEQQITTVLANRKANLPTITREIERWENTLGELKTLNQKLQEYNHDNTDNPLSFSALNDIQSKIPNTLKELGSLQERFNRDTINIGVSGQARVGKSTLLQTISGLNENQIPTGDNLPVTAVKSQIYHSNDNIAHVEFHTFDSFKENVLLPYHERLGLITPETLTAFKGYKYPNDLSDLTNQEPSNITILQKLKQMQTALFSYENLLGQNPQNINLEALREYVAYPTSEQEKDESACSRKYLAVKDVKIFCPFPTTPVSQLGLIDLPGLGELSASLEEHHLQGVKNGVDFVILVKKPGGTDGFWTAKDGAAVNMLDKAKSFQDRKDFISILINKDKRMSDEQLSALRGHILREVNEGENNKNYHVLETDVIDKTTLDDELLTPVMSHLAERLDVMDKQIINGVFGSFNTLDQDIISLIDSINNQLKAGMASNGSLREELDDMAKEIRDKILMDIADYCQKVTPNNDRYTKKYEAAIEERSNQIKEWIENGFGEGEEQWVEEIQKKARQKKGLLSAGEDACNEVRVAISQQLTELDVFFNQEIDEFLADIANFFKEHTGELISSDNQGKTALRELSQHLNNIHEDGSPNPANILAKAINDLCDIELNYRKQIHPRMRESLNTLEARTINEDGNTEYRLKDGGSAEGLYKEVKSLAIQALYNTKLALLDDVDFPRQVLFATLEHFDDEVARSKDSERNFKRMTHAYFYDLDPVKFKDYQMASKRMSDIRSSLNNLQNLTKTA